MNNSRLMEIERDRSSGGVSEEPEGSNPLFNCTHILEYPFHPRQNKSTINYLASSKANLIGDQPFGSPRGTLHLVLIPSPL